MSFWSVLLSVLYVIYLNVMYGLGYEIGYSRGLDELISGGWK
jgi:hypothetical protein